MNGITIDVGNTALKTAYFKDGVLSDFKRKTITNLEGQIAEAIKGDYSYIALCSVKPSVLEMVAANFPQITIVDSNDYDDMIKMYLGNPPQHGAFAELGVDIAVGCYGALAEGDGNVIVVDSGTATTVTAVVDSVIEAVYIYPGFRLSKKSLFGGTEALDGDYRLKIKSGRAANTDACIDLAVYHGTNGAVKEIIHQIEAMYDRKFKVYITGGDTDEFYIDAYRRDDKLVNIGLERYIRSKGN
ncbi:type III pantothenate kinase [Mollicutes bacterium LVI A0039]|nr:type III pantothenate kinase [Mollicutes bacterium LVI A0039]